MVCPHPLPTPKPGERLMRRRLPLQLLACLLALPLAPLAAKEAEAKIVSVEVRDDTDSTGQAIRKLTVVTQQDKVPMWGILTVSVLVKDRDGLLYFGEASFEQPTRADGPRSLDRWEFHVVVEGLKLKRPEVVGYYVRYANKENDKILATRVKNVKDPEAWLRDNQNQTPLTVKGDFHRLMD
jgi:hypothetical protein